MLGIWLWNNNWIGYRVLNVLNRETKMVNRTRGEISVQEWEEERSSEAYQKKELTIFSQVSNACIFEKVGYAF